MTSHPSSTQSHSDLHGPSVDQVGGFVLHGDGQKLGTTLHPCHLLLHPPREDWIPRSGDGVQCEDLKVEFYIEFNS